jgi:hypothetical protein
MDPNTTNLLGTNPPALPPRQAGCCSQRHWPVEHINHAQQSDYGLSARHGAVMAYRFRLGHITVDTYGNVQIVLFLCASLISQDL